ncbi:MAG: BlaI/MecI/CopY family transcriptional regulator [Planctomycetota bacterium]
MSETHELTDLQVAVMQVLWESPGATAQDVRAALEADHRRELAPTTVATLLTRLEKRGLIEHETIGRQYAYRARVSAEDIRGSMVRGLADRLFGGDVAQLVSHFLAEHEVAEGDLVKVREMIAAKERELKKKRKR